MGKTVKALAKMIGDIHAMAHDAELANDAALAGSLENAADSLQAALDELTACMPE